VLAIGGNRCRRASTETAEGDRGRRRRRVRS
jgi:hypothetical protein